VRDRLAQADAAGFLLDGYPRNLGQVGDLDGFLDERGEPLGDRVGRAARRVHPAPVAAGDRAGPCRRQRRVDREASGIYESDRADPRSLPRAGIVDQIDGVGPLDEVYARIQAALEARGIAAS
jgi:adenylate kinase